mmetsp:Transcript_20289/g.27997  ORF Transcript_20289/g.27997 Transcript_20289/m.27997 type:complete len:903 (+) Transcript_20289:445-3153(+)
MLRCLENRELQQKKWYPTPPGLSSPAATRASESNRASPVPPNSEPDFIIRSREMRHRRSSLAGPPPPSLPSSPPPTELTLSPPPPPLLSMCDSVPSSPLPVPLMPLSPTKAGPLPSKIQGLPKPISQAPPSPVVPPTLPPPLSDTPTFSRRMSLSALPSQSSSSAPPPPLTARDSSVPCPSPVRVPAPAPLPPVSPLPTPLVPSTSASSFPAPLSQQKTANAPPPSPSLPPPLPLQPKQPDHPSAEYLRRRRGSAPVTTAPPPAHPTSSPSLSSSSLPLPPIPNSQQTEGGSTPAERKLLRAMEELYATEVSYHAVLSAMVDYIAPLEQEGVPAHHIRHLLGNVIELHDVSAKLVSGFRRWRLGETKSVFEIFNSIGTQLLTSMIAYCDHYKGAQKTVKDIITGEVPEYKKTSEILTKIFKQKKSSSTEFSSLLIQPIQRVMRYKMILEEIKKNLLESTSPSHTVLKADIEASIGITGQIADRVNEYQRKLEVQKESRLLATEFSHKFENGDEFVTEIENEFISRNMHETEVHVLEPCTEVEEGSSSSWKYPRRSATGGGKRMTYLMAEGMPDECLLSEGNRFIFLHGTRLIRASGHRKGMMIEDVVSITYGFYHRGSGEERESDLQIITPNHNFILCFKTHEEVEEWQRIFDGLFERLNSVDRIRRKRRKLSRRIVHYGFNSYVLGTKRYRKHFCLNFMDTMSDEQAGTKFLDGCGYGLVGQSGETDAEKAKYLAKSKKRERRGSLGRKGSSSAIVKEEEILALDDEEDEEDFVASPVIRRYTVRGEDQQRGSTEVGGRVGSDPAVAAMYDQLKALASQKEVLKDKYEKNVVMVRANIVRRKRLLLEHGDGDVVLSEEELQWEKEMNEKEEDSGSGTPKRKRFQKLFSPKASPSHKRLKMK